MTQKRIILYTSAGCAACDRVKAHLGARGVAAEIRDVTVDESAQLELMDMGVSSVPATVVDGGAPILGAKLDEIDAAIGG